MSSCTWQWPLYVPNTLCRCKNCTLIKTAPQWRYRCARSDEGETTPLHWASSIHSMTSRLKVSIHDINPSMISVIFDDVRTNSNRASLPAVNTPIDFFLPPSIRPMDFLQETILPRVWRRWYLWPSCERDQSSTGTTVDALIDHLPQDSSVNPTLQLKTAARANHAVRRSLRSLLQTAAAG